MVEAEVENGVIIPFRRRIMVKEIVEATIAYHKMDPADFFGPSHQYRFAHPRQQAMWLADRLRPDVSFPMVARALRKLDHTTVLNGVRRVQERIENGKDDRIDVVRIAGSLGVERLYIGPRQRRLTRKQEGAVGFRLKRGLFYREFPKGEIDEETAALHTVQVGVYAPAQDSCNRPAV